MIWFTSDLHLDHNSILTLGKGRPFASVQQMNEEIIKRWNKTIGLTDTVYVLGDVCWGWNSKKIKETFSKMNGIKYLIYGNHDRIMNHQKSNMWVEIIPYKELFIDNIQVVLSHYPIADWHGAYRKGIHLYGHCHGNFDLSSLSEYLPHHNKRCMDVGVDTNDFYPYSWDDIKKKFEIVSKTS